MEIKLLEAEVEDYIFERQLLETYSIKCIRRQVRFGVAGIVDILGYDKQRRCWVIIEIKRDALCTKAYAQGMRYRNWLSNYLMEKHFKRGGVVDEAAVANLPYVLLIGASLCHELRFLAHACVNTFYGDACYLSYSVQPKLELGSDYTSNEYRWGMFEDMEGGQG
jgi:hypothetical protein